MANDKSLTMRYILYDTIYVINGISLFHSALITPTKLNENSIQLKNIDIYRYIFILHIGIFYLNIV